MLSTFLEKISELSIKNHSDLENINSKLNLLESQINVLLPRKQILNVESQIEITTVPYNNINVYKFDNGLYQDFDYISVGIGTYTFNVPTNHPIGFVIDDSSKIEISGNEVTSGLNSSITSQFPNVKFYNGIITLNVIGDFDVTSYLCGVHGYMGGENRLKFN